MAKKKATIVQELQQNLEMVPEANIKYKDNVFRALFSNKENLLSLYNALNGKQYSDPDALEIVTLENAIYMGMKNDLAFILDFNIFLWEHQNLGVRPVRPGKGTSPSRRKSCTKRE